MKRVAFLMLAAFVPVGCGGMPSALDDGGPSAVALKDLIVRPPLGASPFFKRLERSASLQAERRVGVMFGTKPCALGIRPPANRVSGFMAARRLRGAWHSAQCPSVSESRHRDHAPDRHSAWLGIGRARSTGFSPMNARTLKTRGRACGGDWPFTAGKVFVEILDVLDAHGRIARIGKRRVNAHRQATCPDQSPREIGCRPGADSVGGSDEMLGTRSVPKGEASARPPPSRSGSSWPGNAWQPLHRLPSHLIPRHTGDAERGRLVFSAALWWAQWRSTRRRTEKDNRVPTSSQSHARETCPGRGEALAIGRSSLPGSVHPNSRSIAASASSTVATSSTLICVAQRWMAHSRKWREERRRHASLSLELILASDRGSFCSFVMSTVPFQIRLDRWRRALLRSG